MKKLRAIWYFIIYGIPKIWSATYCKEQSRWFVIKCAWIAAVLTSATYKIREKENDNTNER